MTLRDWSTAERNLLRAVADAVGPCIASPDYNISLLADGYGSGGGEGFHYEFTKTAIVGTWHEFIPAAWHDDGTTYRWQFGLRLDSVKVTYARLQKWIESLPADVREQAAVWWRTAPPATRNLAALHDLTLTALGAPTPTETREPTDLLELLEMTNG